MAAGFSIHRRAWELIPWIVNGTVDARERAAVEAHVGSCELCRAELQFQRELHAAIAAGSPATPETGMEAGWQRLRERLQGDRPGGPEAPAVPPMPGAPAAAGATHARASGRRWIFAWAAAAVVEAIALGALAMALWSQSVPAPMMRAPAVYRTLSAAPATPAPASIRVVLAPATTVAQLQALLERNALRIVDGPSSAGAWSLAAAPASGQSAKDAILKSLRADPRVRFAEPLDSGR